MYLTGTSAYALQNVSTGTYYKREWLQRLNIAWSHAGIGFAVGADSGNCSGSASSRAVDVPCHTYIVCLWL